jgi:hypothetical protein
MKARLRFSKRSPSHKPNKQNRRDCAPCAISPGCGVSKAARDLVAPGYSWFTEGFDAADLKEAKVLLDQLARAAVSRYAMIAPVSA